MLCSVSAPFVCQLDLLCVYKRLWKHLYVWQPLLSLSSLGDIVSRPWRRCSGCGWMSAGSGFKCLLPMFKYTFTVIHSSSASHIIVFTLFCLNPVWSGNNSTACFHITCTTRYVRLNAGSVLGSSEHVDGRMEKWLFCSVQCECVNSAVDPGCYHLGSASIQTKDPGEAMPLYQHVSNNVSSDSSFTVGLLLFPRLLKLFRRVADVTRGFNTSDKHHRPAGSRTGTNSDFLWVYLV